MDYKSLQSYVKAELGGIITMVAVSIMILSNNILMTIPFVIIFLGVEIKPGNIEDKSAYKEKYGKLPVCKRRRNHD